jgi:hypothetical protein
MSVKGGPDIVTDGLVFNLDAAGAVSDRAYPINGLPVEYLIVAGGGGGGGVIGGGGGAGGLLHGYTRASLSTGSYTVTVGAGGAGGTGWNTSSQDGKVGGNSSAFSVTSTGGGGGDHHGGATSSTTKNGGSGGGGANGSYNGGTGISGQGNNGGNNGNGDLGAGGGGAGGVGTNAGNAFVVNSKGGNGGIGRYFGYSFGRSLGEDGWFAGGGGGGVRSYRGPYIPGVGSSGAGSGGFNSNDANINGNASANTGSGGGGGGYNVSYSSRSAGNGGSGVVIIKYKGPQKATGGDSIITRKGYTIHVFTSSGTFTVGGRVGGLSTSKIVGTLENMGPSDYSTGNKGYFSFDGSNQYIQTPVTAGNLGISSAGGKFSIDIWYRDNSDGSTNRALFTTFRGYNATIEIHANSTYRFYVNIEDNNGDRALFGTANNSYASGEWVNGTLVWDGSVKTAYVYLNGELQGYNTNTLVDNTLEYYGDPLPFRIGSTIVPNYQYGALPLLGDVASVKVYDNVALSEKQIKDNYNATKGRFGL